uniref:Uncharacterized protein n=1 Tax=Caudovirales sp. ctUJJ3 TaxID=2826777 RepID=A0A8S5NFP3_9CAUD|nr:MAG TPA: hypothetical protein [Caudovirales sp. ctUJJ3]DAI55897.1 MAG TPA: hypothetical protein [Caudoviricetes sp.]
MQRGGGRYLAASSLYNSSNVMLRASVSWMAVPIARNASEGSFIVSLTDSFIMRHP